MSIQKSSPNYRNNLLTAFLIAALFGVATIFLAFTYEISGKQQIYQTARFLSDAGNAVYLLAANALLIFWAWRKKLHSIIKLALSIDLFVWIAVQLTKLIPFGEWALRPGALPGGFPSGHTTHAFAMAVLLTTYFPRTWWLWYPLAAAIAWSRIEVFEHTALQVTAGVFYGIIIGWVFISQWIKREQAISTGESVRLQESQA
jgi:membrane-associated phospholipid phosphatase